MNFKISRYKREPYFKMKQAHYHSEYEIYYLISGCRKFFINDTIYNVKKGDMLIISKGDIHRTTYISNESHERISLLFSGELLNLLYDDFGKEVINKCFDYQCISIPVSRREYIEELLSRMENEYKQSDVFSNLLIKNYMKELLIFIIRLQKYIPVSYSDNIAASDEDIQKAARFITQNYKKNITLNSVAEHINMSPTYFSKKFRKSTGFGFKEYLLNIRIKKAASLLLETNNSITDIAYSCGFNDSNYFGDVFKRVKGTSPLKYRKNMEFI